VSRAARRPDGRVVFVLGDVSGKGLPAAMVMSSLQTALRTALDFRPDLPQAMSHLSRHLKERLRSEVFVTMVVGLLDPPTGRLEYVNAGHILPVMLDATGAVLPGRSRGLGGIGTAPEQTGGAWCDI